MPVSLASSCMVTRFSLRFSACLLSLRLSLRFSCWAGLGCAALGCAFWAGLACSAFGSALGASGCLGCLGWGLAASGFGSSFFALGFASGFLVSCLTGCGSLPDARYSPRSLTAVSRVRASSRALTSFSSKVAPVLRVSPVSSAKVSITFLVLMPKSFAISVTLYLKSTIG